MTQIFDLIEKFPPIAPGVPGDDAIAVYERDGVVCLKGAFSDEWVEKGRRAVAAAIRSQASSKEHSSHKEKGETGRFFLDNFFW